MIKQKGLMRTKSYARRAQAIVEFAIVLPILLVVLIGIFEVARYVFIYSAVTNASRNASRYASAVGYEETGTYLKHRECCNRIGIYDKRGSVRYNHILR